MNIELILIVIILVFIFTKSQENYSPILSDYTISNNVNPNNNELNPNNFDIYIIHMKKNADRMINFDKYYNNSDLKFKKYNIFPAIIGKDLNLVDYVTPNTYQQIIETEKTLSRKHHYDLTRGAVGCYLSHIAIYKKIVNSGIPYGIVFEDDCIINSSFYEKLKDGLKKLPNDWDIFLLGLMCIKCDIKEDYVKVSRFWGTHAYIIKNKSAAKILEHLDKPLSKQIDADLSLLDKKNIIKIYSINPVITTQEGAFVSDIQLDVEDTSEAFNEEFRQRGLMKYRTNQK